MIRAFFMTTTLIGIGLFIYAAWVEPRQLHIREIAVGTGDRVVRIALVTDIHIGGLHVPPARVARLVERINAQAPDLVLLPGDFINGHTRRGEMTAAGLAALSDGFSHLSALTAPAIATTGNHDVWHGQAAVARMLDAAGVRVIDNSAVRMLGMCVVGVADFLTDQPSAAGFDLCEAGEPIISLMHSPDARGFVPKNAALAVAGHTHGGQVNLPIVGRRVTSTYCGRPCAYGLIQDDPPFVVSAGIGTSILPIRFRAPPEIMMITLRISPQPRR
jgi:predicted MPP superfamily phosphohydrolase